MAIASLVLAILAIVIAALSALYTRRQAVAAAGVHEIEHSRRLGERRPRLSGKVERLATGLCRLVVTLESDEPLTAMQVTIPHGQGVTFDRNVYGVWPGASPGQVALTAFTYDVAGNPAGLKPRGVASWKVDVAEEHEDTLQLEATCRGLADEQWDSVLIKAPVEPDISKTV